MKTEYPGSGTLLLIDGHSLAYRAYYGMPGLEAPDGTKTGAVSGFLNMLLKIIAETRPEHAAAAFDIGRPAVRTAKYGEYKANRQKMPEDMIPQMDLIYELTGILGIPILTVDGYEADDCLGSAAKLAEGKGLKSVIASSDRDLLQLVSPGVRVLCPKKGVTEFKLYDEAAVNDEYGFAPKSIVDYKALAGDSSDNIPGGKGIGDKTAKKLIAEYGTAEEIIAGIPLMTGRVKKLAEESKDMILLSKDLATIRTDLPIPPESIEARPVPDEKRLAEFLSRLGMKALLAKIMPDKAAAERSATGHSAAAGGESRSADDYFAIMRDGKITDEEGRTFPPEALRRMTGERTLCLFDAKPVIRAVMKTGTKFPEKFNDIALACYLLSPDANAHDFRKAYRSLAMEDLPDDLSDEETFEAMKRLRAISSRGLEDSSMTEVFEKVEQPLLPILAEMEENGILCDPAVLLDADERAERKAAALEEAIHACAGEKFNVNSPKQLSAILYDKLGLPSFGKRSTDAERLGELKSISPIIPLILEYREARKLQTTYTAKLPSQIDPDGRIRTNFDSMKTATGRLSSSDPNLQNIPVKTEQGKEIRRAFHPAPGFIFISADYSQIELRVMAHLSGDPKMIEAFERDLDIHSITASEIFGTPQSEITPAMRKKAKQVNFGIIYGMTAHGLSLSTGATRKEAAAYIERYFERFPKISEFIRESIEKAEATGYAETMSGRRRPVENITSRNRTLKAAADRIAVNSVVQGTAADIIKSAMVKISEKMKNSGLKSRMLLQIHDELLFEVSESETNQMKEIISDSMEQNISLKIPLKINIKKGKNWSEME